MATVNAAILFLLSLPALLLVTGGLLFLGLLTFVFGQRYRKAVGVLGALTGLAVLVGGASQGFIQGAMSRGAHWIAALYLVPFVLGSTVLLSAYPEKLGNLRDRVMGWRQ